MTASQIDEQKLIRTLAHALRHDPLKYGLLLDDEGYADLDELTVALRFDRYDWALLESRDLLRAIARTDPGRFDFRDGRLRANYGHSIVVPQLGEPLQPPEVLLHGTIEDALADVRQGGLAPGKRRFVHLTTSRDYAEQVALAKRGSVILEVLVREAHGQGGQFFQANHHVWLTSSVPPAFLRFPG